MRVAIFEINSGFDHSTHRLINTMHKVNKQVELTLISTEHPEKRMAVDEEMDKQYILKEFNSTIKKKSIAWYWDRIFTTVNNLRKRNRLAEEYDVVNIQCTIPVFDQFYLRGLKKKTKVVYTVHDVIPPWKSMFWSMRSLRKVYSLCDALIVHSESNKRQLCELFDVDESKITVIPSGWDMSEKKMDPATAKEQLGLSVNDKCVLFYGGIREQKGLDILIDAMEGIDAVLIVGGAVPYGTTFDQYQERIDKRHIRSYIHAQFVSDELTTIMFNAADVLVLPYKYFFSQSGVLLEGIKYGVPIVSTDVGCFREYIDKYHIGCVCQPNNVSELNNAIQVVLNDKSIKEDRFAVARVENTHENSSKEYLKVFRELLNKQNDK